LVEMPSALLAMPEATSRAAMALGESQAECAASK
jgi:hypothetical protein